MTGVAVRRQSRRWSGWSTRTVPCQTSCCWVGSCPIGAANLRGTGHAALDHEVRTLTATVDGKKLTVKVRVTRLAGYLLAKAHAAYGRRAPKDWYDIAFVLLNIQGGPTAAAAAVASVLPDGLDGATRSAMIDLAANFASESAQGPASYAESMHQLYPELDWDILTADAVTAVSIFHRQLTG